MLLVIVKLALMLLCVPMLAAEHECALAFKAEEAYLSLAFPTRLLIFLSMNYWRRQSYCVTLRLFFTDNLILQFLWLEGRCATRL